MTVILNNESKIEALSAKQHQTLSLADFLLFIFFFILLYLFFENFMCLGLMTWYWITYHGAHPWRRLVLPLSAAIDCRQLFIQGWNLVRLSLSVLPCQMVVSLCRSCLGNHIVEISCMQHPCPVQKTLSSRSFLKAIQKIFQNEKCPRQIHTIVGTSRNCI